MPFSQFSQHPDPRYPEPQYPEQRPVIEQILAIPAGVILLNGDAAEAWVDRSLPRLGAISLHGQGSAPRPAFTGGGPMDLVP
jgi:hypothetical protein